MHIHPNAALLAIDVQKGFDLASWGERNNPAMEANGRALIAAWRATGRPLVHARHDSRTPGSPLAPGQEGNGFKAGFEPLSGELVVPKTVNSAFIGTDLETWLNRAGIRQLVLFGIATDMCVSTSARGWPPISASRCWSPPTPAIPGTRSAMTATGSMPTSSIAPTSPRSTPSSPGSSTAPTCCPGRS